MKLQLPTHVPVRTLLPVLGAVAFIQVVEGTNILTALEFGAFLAICTSAFNLAGGLIYPSGSYIFFLAVLSVGLGGFVKTIFGESLDSNLKNAQRSMLVYVVAACAFWVAARVTASIRAKTPWLSRLQVNERVSETALGSALFGQFGWILVPASTIATFTQLNNFLPLSILLLVYTRVRDTDGKRSFTVLGFCIWFYVTVAWGILAFSKQGMFAPSAVWAIASLVAGYRASLKKLILILVLAGVASSILTPVSQLGRVSRLDANYRAVAWNLLTHPLRTRKIYLEQQASNIDRNNTYHWFSTGQGLLDRLTMFPIDDALITLTDHGHAAGFGPIAARIHNVIPRYLLPGEKITLHVGNDFAHEIGLLGKHDHTTGISFTPISDVYHCLQWWGLLFLAPLYIVAFTLCDSLTGSTKQTIWAALYIILFSHMAPEGMINGAFSAISTFALGIAIAAFFARYVLPHIGGFFLPPKRPRLAPFVAPRWEIPQSVVRPSLARTIEGEL